MSRLADEIVAEDNARELKITRQELAELKTLVREFGSCKIRIGNHDKDVRKRNAKYERLMQAVGLANTDSKEE